MEGRNMQVLFEEEEEMNGKLRLRDRLRTEALIMQAIKTGLVPDFVGSVESFYDKKGSITEKQWNALLNIIEASARHETIAENQFEIY